MKNRSKYTVPTGAQKWGPRPTLNAECWALETGNLVWEERLRGPGPKGDNWSSMVLADGKLYTINQGGDAFVLKASPQFEVLATNSLAEPTIASMAISNGEILIRTHRHLWCIGKAP